MHNLGYGQSLKDGIAASKYDMVVITDADGTYPLSEIPALVAEYRRGFDMVVGQNGHPGQERRRECVLFSRDLTAATVSTTADFVIPTGGGYFFSPSISAMRETLTAR